MISLILYELYKIIKQRVLLILILIFLIFNVVQLFLVRDIDAFIGMDTSNVFKKFEGSVTDAKANWVLEEKTKYDKLLGNDNLREKMQKAKEEADSLSIDNPSEMETVNSNDTADLPGKYSLKIAYDYIIICRLDYEINYIRNWEKQNISLKKLIERNIDRYKGKPEYKYEYLKWNLYKNNVNSIKSPTLFYNTGWDKLYKYISNDLLVLLLILVAFSTVFSNEYALGTDRIIRSSIHGKSSTVTAKFAASFIYALVIYAVFIIIDLVFFKIYYDMPGWHNSLQSIQTFSNSPFAFSIGNYLVILLLTKLLGLMMFGVIILFLSSAFKTSYMPLFIGGIMILIPVLLKSRMPDLEINTLLKFMPDSNIFPQSFFTRYDVYNIFNIPVSYMVICISVTLLAAIVCSIGTYKFFNNAR
ncbi:MAG: hypothetical protein FIA99_18115 [Ruminiclostridium sp.]|nr:hypothetical protein [Ruminiclostridium sp.]